MLTGILAPQVNTDELLLEACVPGREAGKNDLNTPLKNVIRAGGGMKKIPDELAGQYRLNGDLLTSRRPPLCGALKLKGRGM